MAAAQERYRQWMASETAAGVRDRRISNEAKRYERMTLWERVKFWFGAA